MPRFVPRWAAHGLLQLLVLAAYFGTGWLGLRLASFSPSSTAIWAPSGIALAAVLLIGARVWPAIAAAALLVNLVTLGSPAVAVGIAIGNTLEPLVGGWLVKRYAHGRRAFERADDSFKFMSLAALSATAISATAGMISLLAGGVIGASAASAAWLIWWMGDAVGILLIAPPLILWANEPSLRDLGGRLTETTGVVGAAIIAGLLVFTFSDYPLTVLCIAPVIWAAFRLSRRETSSVVLISAALAAFGTIEGTGPFIRAGHDVSMLLLEVYAAALAAVALPVSALIQQHERAEREAQQANHAKDEFTAMVAHELRNPVNTIVLAAHTLRELPPGAPAGERMLKSIERGAQLLTNRVNELLESSRIISGTLLVERRPLDLIPVIKSAVELMRPAAEAKRIRLESFIPAEAAIGEADGERIHQCVANLLGNAIKFTPEGGNLEVRVRSQQAQLELVVRDSGVGIAAELLPRIFDRHAQGARSRTGGLGLGLFIVKHLIEAHDGRIEARSAGLGQGATFSVRLPLLADATAASRGDHPLTTRESA